MLRSRDCGVSKHEGVAILRDAVLRTAPQDEVWDEVRNER